MRNLTTGISRDSSFGSLANLTAGVDFDLQDTTARGGGPHYVIDPASGIILTKRYEQ
jgi:hypothetical protein